MKNIISLLLILACVSLSCSVSLAMQNSGTINVTVTVKGSFNMMVNTDSFDFANLKPGQTGEMTRAEGVMVTGTSSSGNPWYLKVAAVRPLSSGENFIPNENFTWYGTSEGQGNWYGAAEKNFSESNQTAYICSADEAEEVKKVVNKFKFKLHVPEETKSGLYTTTVMFTMTE